MCNCMYQPWYVFLSVKHGSSQSCNKRLLYFSCFSAHLDCINREGCRRGKPTTYTTFSIFNMLLLFLTYVLNSSLLHRWLESLRGQWLLLLLIWLCCCVRLYLQIPFCTEINILPQSAAGTDSGSRVKVHFSTCYCYKRNAGDYFFLFLFIVFIYDIDYFYLLIYLYKKLKINKEEHSQNPN